MHSAGIGSMRTQVCHVELKFSVTVFLGARHQPDQTQGTVQSTTTTTSAAAHSKAAVISTPSPDTRRLYITVQLCDVHSELDMYTFDYETTTP